MRISPGRRLCAKLDVPTTPQRSTWHRDRLPHRPSRQEHSRSIAMDELDLIGDAEFFTRSFACSVNNWLMSCQCDDSVIGAQVHSISPNAASRALGSRFRRSAAPRVASFSGVNGLWMR